MALLEPPILLGYYTWRDENGFHARYFQELPESALLFGCRSEVHAASPLELTQAAVRNRIKVWVWQARPTLSGDISGWPEAQDPR